MQFNFVVSTNVRAVLLWERHGFAVVGRSSTTSAKLHQHRTHRARRLGDFANLI
ncbi:hypothetical protein EMIHUDRAFT_252824 [Emiliania huxleyi CCMP1516]|uniref:N-acetyltransferase domain-containing protein n=2 Tax=Emiliania huxleyi TaxID=2903 RepID=A0A0D3KG04_EMIH1|nr:hypothetical protein EMIHUDRAFT_252824 [Emiliania huxleyi CCMP1516]EOD34689.1 hypothetical protein EMIHUDRAFT_252824 [Emiliania huxleyi CCMP1516]|eukprot:XP_005787118.1 hypothetical protein EMIHUDRAFT_252824 [Emiliania huxleyi CCMP1516]